MISFSTGRYERAGFRGFGTMADEKTEHLIETLEALRGTFPSERMAEVNEAFIAWLKEGGNQKRG